MLSYVILYYIYYYICLVWSVSGDTNYEVYLGVTSCNLLHNLLDTVFWSSAGMHPREGCRLHPLPIEIPKNTNFADAVMSDALCD